MKAHPLSLALVLLASPLAASQEKAGQEKTEPQKTEPQKTEPEKAAQPQAQGETPAAKEGTVSAEQLEQIVAPIALYPDSLLSQILMASTYPLEVVEAARWLDRYPDIKPDKLEAELQKMTWDPSVKSLCGFRDVLKRMNDNLDWTQDLGDAFLGQKTEVMEAVQRMRRKALDAGTLKSSKELTVKEETDKIIVIQSANPEVVYVPTYYPSACYGSWHYPYWYYPPMYYPPPAGGAWFGFSVGVVWGAAIWGDCDWNNNDIDIDIDKQNNFIDRTEGQPRRQEVKDKARTSDRAASDRAGNKSGKGGWNHNSEHRKGVGYKDSKTASKYGGGPGQTRVSRDQARGFGDGSSSTRPSTSNRASGASGASARDLSSSRSGSQASARPSSSASSRTSASTGQRSSSFSGSRSPSFDRASSSRGSSSRGSAGSRGGGSRGGGGGGRR